MNVLLLPDTCQLSSVTKLIITVSGKINRIRNYDFKEYFSLSYMEKR